MTEKHVHDCTGPDMTCPCGFVFRIPPVSVSLSVYHLSTELVEDHFNCETVDDAIAALRQAADTLERSR